MKVGNLNFKVVTHLMHNMYNISGLMRSSLMCSSLMCSSYAKSVRNTLDNTLDKVLSNMLDNMLDNMQKNAYGNLNLVPITSNDYEITSKPITGELITSKGERLQQLRRQQLNSHINSRINSSLNSSNYQI